MKKTTIFNKKVDEKLKFIEEYRKAKNAATGSEFDSNANVVDKNVATLQTEATKGDLIALNYRIEYEYLKRRYGDDLANQFLIDEDTHVIYPHDSTSIMPYCVSISLYPFLLKGLRELGGTSGAPNHANSFIGGLINLIFLVAGQFAGAVAVPETLPYFDHFLRKDYGEDYISHLDEPVETLGDKTFTLRHKIEDWFQQFVYSINQPAGARNYQSPFTNISYYDEYYFKSIFKDFVFPDGDEPCWETTKELQKMFMKWFNKEREKEVLTFPVETVNLLTDKDTREYKDKEMADFTAEMWSEGHSFFLYQSDSADALSSCCRLRNAIEQNVFSYTLGAGGIETGSKKVITININHVVQDWYNNAKDKMTLKEYITPIVERVHKYLNAWNDYLWDNFNADLLTVYKAGFIDLDKQYLTVGFNGFIEGAEFLSTHEGTEYFGLTTKPDDEKYKQYAKDLLVTIKELDKKDRTEHEMYNCEMVPAESAGSKLYNWDKKNGYWVPDCRNLYNSYFYPVEDSAYDPITKMYSQGKDFTGCLDGGSAYHCNLDSHLSKAQYRKMMDIAVKAGCNYFTFNIPETICNECGHIDKRFLHECPKCGSKNVDFATRVIGYLKRVSNFSEIRQAEAKKRYFAHI